MKASEFNMSELTGEDMRQTNGGFFVLIALIEGAALNAAWGAVLATPIVAAAIKGWNDAAPH